MPEPTPSDLLVPEGTCVVHIGPPKTATTAVQGAFWAARSEVAAQGVHYAGHSRHSAGAVTAALGRGSLFFVSGPPMTAKWTELVEEIRAVDLPRVVLSSEFWADAQDEQIADVMGQFGRPVHVVVTLRPVQRIAASHWQQAIQSAVDWSFDEWLHSVVDADSDDRLNPDFWHRHRHQELVARWAAAVGADNMTLVVLDPRDRDHVLRAFESLTGLRAGTLVATDDLANRSLTWPEVEGLRAFNSHMIAAGMPKGTRRRVGHAGAAHFVKQFPADPADPRVEVPAWAMTALDDAAQQIVLGLKASGVRVVGDLDSLAPSLAAGAPDELPSALLTPEVAGRLAAGVLAAAGGVSWEDLGAPSTALPPLLVPRSAARPGLAQRVRRAAGRGWRTVRPRRP